MSQQTRHVRIGIVYRGNVIAERVLCRRTHVSVGLRPDTTVQIAASEYPDFPASVEILRLAGGRYHLVLPNDPQARVTLRGASVDNVTVEIEGRRCLPVEAVAGGSLQVGELCVMFQFVAGYAQPMEVRERTVLRLGLVYEQRLIADRLYADAAKVSVGRAKGDALMLDEDYQGPSLSFERHKDGTATLQADRKVSLRMAAPGERPLDGDELIARGLARLQSDALQCHLALGTRGRVRMGPYTVLFQVLRQRVEVPVLPRHSWGQRLTGVFFRDPVWTACLALWTGVAMAVSVQAWAMHMTYGRYMKNIQPPEDQYVEELHTTFIEVPIVEPIVPEAPPLEPIEAPPTPEKAPVEDSKRPSKARPRQAHSEADPDKAPRNPRAAVLRDTIAGSLAGPSTTRLFADDDGSGQGEVLPRQAFAGGGSGDATGPGAVLDLKGAADVGQTYERPVVKRTALARSETKNPVASRGPEQVVKIDFTAEPTQGEGQGKSAVSQVIARKSSAIRRCYEAELRSNANLQAKVVVSFTVGTAGTITQVRIMGATGKLASCIESKFMRIRGLPILTAPQPFKQTYIFQRS